MSRVKEIEEKIKKEKMVLDGAMKMHVAQADPLARQMVEITINEVKQRVGFLEGELRKLNVKGVSDAQNVTPSAGNVGFATFDLLKCELHDNITTDKVKFRLSEISMKLDIETRVRCGFENIIEALNKSGAPDIKKRQELEQQVQVTKAKEILLQKAKNKYTQIYVADEEEEDRIVANDTAHKYSGRLKLRLIEAVNITSRRNNHDIIATLLIDGVTQHVSKPQNKRWDESIDLQVDKANEVEIQILEKGGQILSLIWFRLEDLVKDLDEKYGKTRQPNLDVNDIILDLQPCGQLQLKINFLPIARNKSSNDKIFRRDAVQKVYPRNGHRYIARQFYQVMQCTVCNEFLGRNGYQCISCNNTVHPRCYNRVSTKCIPPENMADASDKNTGQLLKYNIPHRWDNVVNFGASWCAHCGYVLPPTKKTHRCSECNIHSHRECSIMVPNFCGLDSKMMDVLVAAFEAHEQKLHASEFGDYGKKHDTPIFSQSEINQLKDSFQAIINQGEKNTNSKSDNEPKEGNSATIEKEGSQVPVPSTSFTGTVPLLKIEEAPRMVDINDFHFIAVLGRGAFGKVMLASEKVTGQLYAIKALKKEFIIQNDDVRSVKLEKIIFQAASKTQHPFLVNLHSTFDSPGRVYFVMEYVSGGDLMCHILENKRFQQGRARFYAAEVLLAIQYFHENNIIYRDLKLDNILLCANGHIKVADYGICKNNIPFGATTATFCGTPDYMAPEILLNRRYGLSVDWWSFGVLIYVMLVGNYPFHGDDESDILEAILADAIEYPNNLPKVTTNILQSLMTKNPARRLGSSREDAEEIKRHPYFIGVDWDALLRRECTPPFLPKIANPHDVSNFDQEFTREAPVLTPINSVLSNVDQKEFEDFAFVSDWVFEARAKIAKMI